MKRVYDLAFSTGLQEKASEGFLPSTEAREEIAKIHDQLKDSSVAAKLREAVEDNLPIDY
jgi:hypothetical protein